jgi:hypothetical protein
MAMDNESHVSWLRELVDDAHVTPIREMLERAEDTYAPATIKLADEVELGDVFEAVAVALGRYRRRLLEQGFDAVQANQYSTTAQYELVARLFNGQLTHRLFVRNRPGTA